MPKRNVEIVEQGDDLIFKTRMVHGPNHMHTVTVTPHDVLAMRNAYRKHLNRLSPAVSGEAREENMQGVDRVGFSLRKIVRFGGKGVKRGLKKATMPQQFLARKAFKLARR